MKTRFDHSNTFDRNFAFMRKLEKAGFILGSNEVEHPGKHFCRFIYFPQDKKHRTYLEFIHVGKNGEKIDTTGLSFASVDALKKIYKNLVSKKIECKLSHKNYDWKNNNIDRLPGWNFIEFPKKMKSLEFWGTEYEKNPFKKRPTVFKIHLNGVSKILSLEMALSPKDLPLFESIFKKEKDGALSFFNGVSIHYKLAKKTHIQSIVLGTKNLKKMVKEFEWDELISYRGVPAVKILNPNENMWDILVVQI